MIVEGVKVLVSKNEVERLVFDGGDVVFRQTIYVSGLAEVPLRSFLYRSSQADLLVAGAKYDVDVLVDVIKDKLVARFSFVSAA